MAQVSIGVPTYNGADYIAACLTCLREQTFEDFDVFISDNASTDGTSDICADFQRLDRRFRHVRFDRTVPAAENFARARDMTEAPFFMWRADDDLSAPNYIESLVARLSADKTAGLAVAPIRSIRHQPIRKEKLFQLPAIDGRSRVSTFRSVLLGSYPSWYYGLWRRGSATEDAKNAIAKYPYLWASDHIGLLPVILNGAVVMADDTFFVQNMTGKGVDYRLASKQLLSARNIYLKIAEELVNNGNWNEHEKAEITRIIGRHVNWRVVSKYNVYRKYIKEILESLLPIGKI